MSLLSYLGNGENRERYLGVKIPPTNLETAIWTTHAPSLPDSRTVSPSNNLRDGACVTARKDRPTRGHAAFSIGAASAGRLLRAGEGL